MTIGGVCAVCAVWALVEGRARSYRQIAMAPDHKPLAGSDKTARATARHIRPIGIPNPTGATTMTAIILHDEVAALAPASAPRSPAQRAWDTCRATTGAAPRPPGIGRKYVSKLRAAMRASITSARKRQAERAAAGKPSAAVVVTLDDLMRKLKASNFCCELTGLPFWQDDADRFGPSMPSLDRIDPGGDYSRENLRVVLLGINGLRGRGSHADMRRFAEAIIKNRAGQP